MILTWWTCSTFREFCAFTFYGYQTHILQLFSAWGVHLHWRHWGLELVAGSRGSRLEITLSHRKQSGNCMMWELLQPQDLWLYDAWSRSIDIYSLCISVLSVDMTYACYTHRLFNQDGTPLAPPFWGLRGNPSSATWKRSWPKAVEWKLDPTWGMGYQFWINQWHTQLPLNMIIVCY